MGGEGYPYMESYSAIKRNEVPTQAITWMHHGGIVLSERNRTQKVTYCLIPYIYEMLTIGKSIETENRFVVGKGWRGVWGMTA